VRFAYVTSLQAEGKQTHILCEPKTLLTWELRQRATNYCRWEIMFIVWTVYASFSATPLIHLPFTSNGRGTHRFVPTTVHSYILILRHENFLGKKRLQTVKLFCEILVRIFDFSLLLKLHFMDQTMYNACTGLEIYFTASLHL
jgi:hypothetical protein